MNEETIAYEGKTIGRIWTATQGLYAGCWFASNLLGRHQVFPMSQGAQAARDWLVDDYTRQLPLEEAERLAAVVEEMISVDEDPENIAQARATLAFRALIAISRGHEEPAALADIILSTYQHDDL